MSSTNRQSFTQLLLVDEANKNTRAALLAEEQATRTRLHAQRYEILCRMRVDPSLTADDSRQLEEIEGLLEGNAMAIKMRAEDAA